MAGFSQDELVKRSGLSKSTIQNIEGGKTKPYGSTLLNYARGLGYETYEQMYQAATPHFGANSYFTSGVIPVLASVPASYNDGGDVIEAYNHEEAIDTVPRSVAPDLNDYAAFGLIIKGDSMAPRYLNGNRIICSPKHWIDHGFVDGFAYAIRLDNDETTVKVVHNRGGDIELVAVNSEYPSHTISNDLVVLAALVRFKISEEPSPDNL